jgi:hypothetical protein
VNNPADSAVRHAAELRAPVAAYTAAAGLGLMELDQGGIPQNCRYRTEMHTSFAYSDGLLHRRSRWVFLQPLPLVCQ